jgi:hypothetical protein
MIIGQTTKSAILIFHRTADLWVASFDFSPRDVDKYTKFQVKSASLLIDPLLEEATRGGNKDDALSSMRYTGTRQRSEGGNGGGLHREVARFRVRSSLTRTIAVAEND